MEGKRHRLVSTRKAAGFSQERLAETVGVERTTVMRWERGETRPQPWARPKLARALGIADQELSDLLGEPAEPESAASACGLLADKVVRVSDWSLASESPSIATIRAMSESFQVADRRLGGGLLYHSVLRYIRLEIAPSLLDPPRDCLSSELFSAAASLTDVAGWMAHDGGNDDKSQRHFNQAYHLAVAAKNPALSANVCASLSHLAVQRGQAEDAARISAAGLARVTGIEGTEQLAARLYAMCARAAAIQNLAKECHLALDAAREALCGRGGPTRAEWIAEFDEASLAGESAHCFYSLGALAEAENQARKVIELRRVSDRVRSRTFGQLTLAKVLLKAGAVDEAARVGSEICLVARSINSARVHSDLSQLGKSLMANRAVPEVALFLGHLAQLAKSSLVVPQDHPGWPL